MGYTVLVTVCALHGCALNNEEELGYGEQEIVNGIVDPGHPSVARVFASGINNPTAKTPSCTGVLITSSSILTAAHCVTNGSTHLVRFANGTGFFGTATRHPQYAGTGSPHDVAVVSTNDKMGRFFYSPLAVGVYTGTPITLVGYGQVANGVPQDGIKRYGTNTVDSVDANYFYYNTTLSSPPGQEAATCYGDSGGPAFAGNSECVVGITKGQVLPVPNGPCAPNEAGWRHTRIDNYLGWLEDVTRDPIQTCQP